MHEILSGKLRIRNCGKMHDSSRNLCNVRRGTSSDPFNAPSTSVVVLQSATEASRSSCERAGRNINLYWDVPQHFRHLLLSSLLLVKTLWAEFTSQSLQRSGAVGSPKARSSLAPSSTLSLQAKNWFPWRLAGFQACVSPLNRHEF
jgi:hypothetical protein